MIEERLKITNLEERLKTEMAGGVMGNTDINATAEALRLALQQEERLKVEMGNMKNMDVLLGSAGVGRMLQMLEGGGGGQLESGPASSSGSVPQSPKQQHEQSPGCGAGVSPELGTAASSHPAPPQLGQIRRDVELTKVTGNEANLQYQREIGAHHSLYRKPTPQQQQQHAEEMDEGEEEEEEEEDEAVYRKEMGDAVSVYPKDMSSESLGGGGGYRKDLEPVALVYPQSPAMGLQQGGFQGGAGLQPSTGE